MVLVYWDMRYNVAKLRYRIWNWDTGIWDMMLVYWDVGSDIGKLVISDMILVYWDVKYDVGILSF